MSRVVNRQVIPQQPVSISRETATYRIARIVVIGFLFLLFLPLIPFLMNPVSASVQASAVDLIKTISSVFSGIVGAVVGYYFRTETQT
jgi:hypothetical protein